MRLYRKEKHWSNYWEVHINFPWVGKRNKLGTWMHDASEYGFGFPTKCCLHIEDGNYCTFSLRILGFGVTIIRQSGY